MPGILRELFLDGISFQITRELHHPSIPHIPEFSVTRSDPAAAAAVAGFDACFVLGLEEAEAGTPPITPSTMGICPAIADRGKSANKATRGANIIANPVMVTTLKLCAYNRSAPCMLPCGLIRRRTERSYGEQEDDRDHNARGVFAITSQCLSRYLTFRIE